MLLRIAPAMLQDGRYKCVISREIFEELTRTQKFFERYPWRVDYRSKLKKLPDSVQKSKDYLNLLEVVRLRILETASYGISNKDKRILVCALQMGFELCSGDTLLCEFAHKEFTGTFKGSVSSLGLLNRWLEEGLVAWSPDLEAVMREWKAMHEKPQPDTAISAFKRITGKPYVGP